MALRRLSWINSVQIHGFLLKQERRTKAATRQLFRENAIKEAVMKTRFTANQRALLDLDACAAMMKITPAQFLSVISELGWSIVSIDLPTLALSYNNTGYYRLRSRPQEWPEYIDCSGFIKYLFAQMGVLIPRMAIDQRDFGEPIDETSDLVPGDLVFSTSSTGQDAFDNDPNDQVGHVGMVVSVQNGIMIMDAARSNPSITVRSFEDFVKGRLYRGACRILPSNGIVIQMNGDDAEGDIAAVFRRVCSKWYRIRAALGVDQAVA